MSVIALALTIYTVFYAEFNLAHEGCLGTQPDVFLKAYYILLKG